MDLNNDPMQIILEKKKGLKRTKICQKWPH